MRLAICLLAASMFAAVALGFPGASAAPATSLLIVGNSISRHGPSPEISWNGDWGMAASSSDKDFAHLSSTELGLPLHVINGAPAEQVPIDNGAVLLQKVKSILTPGTLTVLELGDNVSAQNTQSFLPVYDELAIEASRGRGFICLSTYWGNATLDRSLHAVCDAHGGRWVNIGDIFTNPRNPDYQGSPAFLDRDVQRHPHDWSMAQIANRVTIAAKPAVAPNQR